MYRHPVGRNLLPVELGLNKVEAFRDLAELMPALYYTDGNRRPKLLQNLSCDLISHMCHR